MNLRTYQWIYLFRCLFLDILLTVYLSIRHSFVCPFGSVVRSLIHYHTFIYCSAFFLSFVLSFFLSFCLSLGRLCSCICKCIVFVSVPVCIWICLRFRLYFYPILALLLSLSLFHSLLSLLRQLFPKVAFYRNIEIYVKFKDGYSAEWHSSPLSGFRALLPRPLYGEGQDRGRHETSLTSWWWVMVNWAVTKNPCYLQQKSN